jgi:hypothetical protein
VATWARVIRPRPEDLAIPEAVPHVCKRADGLARRAANTVNVRNLLTSCVFRVAGTVLINIGYNDNATSEPMTIASLSIL